MVRSFWVRQDQLQDSMLPRDLERLIKERILQSWKESTVAPELEQAEVYCEDGRWWVVGYDSDGGRTFSVEETVAPDGTECIEFEEV